MKWDAMYHKHISTPLICQVETCNPFQNRILCNSIERRADALNTLFHLSIALCGHDFHRHLRSHGERRGIHRKTLRANPRLHTLYPTSLQRQLFPHSQEKSLLHSYCFVSENALTKERQFLSTFFLPHIALRKDVSLASSEQKTREHHVVSYHTLP